MNQHAEEIVDHPAGSVSRLGARSELEAANLVVAVSPHLDDAMLSVGGTLARLSGRGITVYTHTVFAGVPEGPLSPFALEVHRRCGLDADPAVAFDQRACEDGSGMAVVGAEVHHGALIESIYRRHADGSLVITGTDDIWRPPSEVELEDQAVAAIVDLARTVGADLLLGPAAVGGNLDHVLTSRAVRRAAEQLALPLLLWEDQPYAWNGALLDGAAFEPIALSPEETAAKIEAVALYRSQTQMLWPETDWRALLAAQPTERLLVARGAEVRRG